MNKIKEGTSIGSTQPILLKWISSIILTLFSLLVCSLFIIRHKLGDLIAIFIISSITFYKLYISLNSVNIYLRNGSIVIQHPLKGEIIKNTEQFDRAEINYFISKIYFKDGLKFNIFIDWKGLFYNMAGQDDMYNQSVKKTIMQYGSENKVEQLYDKAV